MTAAPPEMLSQKNVEAVTGIPARVYLEEVRAPHFPLPVVKLGKLRLVNRAAFVAYLESLAVPSGSTEHHAGGVAHDDEIAGVLAEVGVERLPGRAKALQLPPPGGALPRGRTLRK